MNYMEFSDFIKANHPVVIATIVAMPAILLFNMMCCCCFRGNDNKSYDIREEEPVNVEARNSRLAFMLMLLLMENKSINRKYIKMADSIGYDHIIGPTDLLESDTEDLRDENEDE
jgi:hypothetical protein